MSLVLEEIRRGYIAQRGVSQGAGITLVSQCGRWEARMDCAKRCALVLGDRWHHSDIGTFQIPNDEMPRALAKLTETFSVALVDTVTDEAGTRFVLIWKISAVRPPETVEAATVPPSDPNQGNLPLDGDALDNY